MVSIIAHSADIPTGNQFGQTQFRSFSSIEVSPSANRFLARWIWMIWMTRDKDLSKRFDLAGTCVLVSSQPCCLGIQRGIRVSRAGRPQNGRRSECKASRRSGAVNRYRLLKALRSSNGNFCAVTLRRVFDGAGSRPQRTTATQRAPSPLGIWRLADCFPDPA